MPDYPLLDKDDKIIDHIFNQIEGDFEGQSKLLGIRWKLGPKMSVIMCENRIISPFTSLIRVILRFVYITRSYLCLN